MTAGFGVRLLGEADAADWLRLMRAGAEECPSAFLLSGEEMRAITPDDARGVVARGHLHGVFAADDRIVGIAGLNTGGPERVRHRASVGPFYLVQSARGSGAAATLMGSLVRRARAEGIAWLDLWVAVENGRARAFYARAGFAQAGVRRDAVRIEGRPCDDIAMTLYLGPAMA